MLRGHHVEPSPTAAGGGSKGTEASAHRSERDTETVSDTNEWYWDLERETAVPASERGPAANMLGPYPTRADALRWRERVEERNDSWDGADDEWDRDGTDTSD